MICPPLLQTCFIYSTSGYDDFGRQVLSSGVSSLCHFRYINGLQRNTNNETYQCDAMIWLPSDSTVKEGEIVLFDDKYYRIDQLTVARRFDSEIQFIKCSLQIYEYEEGS